MRGPIMEWISQLIHDQVVTINLLHGPLEADSRPSPLKLIELEMEVRHEKYPKYK